MVDISIIIVNWNTRDLLAQCLRSVYDTVQGPAFEVFVVDNASTDGSAAMVRERFPQVLLVENAENVGFARANNQAIRQSAGHYVLLLNSDAYVVGNAVQQMTRLIRDHDDVGIVGASLVFPDGRPQLACGPFPTLAAEVCSLFGLDKRRADGVRPGNPDQPLVETGWVAGACLMARREMLEQVGLLDEKYFMFSEEIDLCYRAHQAGWGVVHVPSARVVHVGGGSTGLTARRILMLYRGKLQYFARHHGAVPCRLLWSAMWLATGLKVFVYTLLRGRDPDPVRRDALWRDVARGLSQVRG